MAKIPTLQRFNTEDFKEQKSWIGRLFYGLNKFISDTNSAFSNNLTFGENMTAQITALEISTKTSVTSGAATLPNYVELQQTYNFKWNLKSAPSDLWITRCLEKSSNPTILRYGVFADWYYKDGQIYIQSVSGLEASKTYTVRFLACAG